MREGVSRARWPRARPLLLGLLLRCSCPCLCYCWLPVRVRLLGPPVVGVLERWLWSGMPQNACRKPRLAVAGHMRSAADTRTPNKGGAGRVENESGRAAVSVRWRRRWPAGARRR